MSSIKFGTDGWRAVVGKDFTKENVEKVCNATAKYIYDNFGKEIKQMNSHILQRKPLRISGSKFCTATKFYQHPFLHTMQRN